ncbi:ABC transporter substrate-binding protein [Paenibacillus sp. SYP-B4298]|uniref:ABC transporter substrate-binding protein n=1 Tax=Paenibacillus sp. SYP-B4298 TaxID=2996034 RepID=UPI0022DE0CEF|nr:sugar ABC transporter substrate-binding protein [Paenibacillus sp. SYP-B4298]
MSSLLHFRAPKAMLALLVLALACTACLPGGSSSLPKPVDKTSTERRITAYMAKNPLVESLKAHLPEFEQATGIKVDLQSLTDVQLSQKLSVQLSVASPTPDVFMIRPLEEIQLFDKNGWLAELSGYTVEDPLYDVADFSRTAMDSVTIDGKLLSIPLSTEQQILYYRKDLLEQAGLEVPKTLDELAAAAARLHRPQEGVYGFVARGQANALVTQLSSFIYSEGGDFQQGNTATLHSAETIRGMKRYIDLLRSYGPAEVLKMSWPQAAEFFSQGKAAFFTDASATYSLFTSGRSLYADKIGYALFPAGSAGSKPYSTTAWSISINPKSAQPDASWAFIRWASSKEQVLEAQKIGNPGARNSLWTIPEGVSGFPAELIPIINGSIRSGISHDRPKVIHVKEARDIIGNIVVRGILGEDIQHAAERANEQFQTLIDREQREREWAQE